METQRVVIVGLGLMGGSLGLALRRQRGTRTIGLDVDRAALRRARSRGIVHETSTDPKRALAGAQRVVFCAPVPAIAPLARQYRPWMSEGALVMDVGSVKAPLVQQLEKLFPPHRGVAFVGAHPMAGSEKNGGENARPDLYQGAVCALTPSPGTLPNAVAAATGFWKSVGASVVLMDADAHDRAVAFVSHLPHLLAEALVLAAREWGQNTAEQQALEQLAARSFQDATRVAGADPALWRGIFKSNEGPVRDAARVFQKVLHRLVDRRWPLAMLRDAQRLSQNYRGK